MADCLVFVVSVDRQEKMQHTNYSKNLKWIVAKRGVYKNLANQNYALPQVVVQERNDNDEQQRIPYKLVIKEKLLQ